MSQVVEISAPTVVVHDGTLRRTRLSKGLTQATLAAEAGLSEPVVNHAEAGRPIRARSAFAIARVLELEPEALFKDAP